MSSSRSTIDEFSQTRYFDFLKTPFDGLSDRLRHQVLPAWKAELDRKGLGSITDPSYNPLPDTPSREYRLRDIDRRERDRAFALFAQQEDDYLRYFTDVCPDRQLL